MSHFITFTFVSFLNVSSTLFKYHTSINTLCYWPHVTLTYSHTKHKHIVYLFDETLWEKKSYNFYHKNYDSKFIMETANIAVMKHYLKPAAFTLVNIYLTNSWWQRKSWLNQHNCSHIIIVDCMSGQVHGLVPFLFISFYSKSISIKKLHRFVKTCIHLQL